MIDDNDIRHGRHCVFKMHVHLVFVAKYRRKVFDDDAIDRLRKERPRHPETLLERRAVVAVLLRFVLRRRTDFHRAPVHRTAADTTLKGKDGYVVRAILPSPERRGLSRTGSKPSFLSKRNRGGAGNNKVVE